MLARKTMTMLTISFHPAVVEAAVLTDCCQVQREVIVLRVEALTTTYWLGISQRIGWRFTTHFAGRWVPATGLLYMDLKERSYEAATTPKEI
jgi:hypothetical protein